MRLHERSIVFDGVDLCEEFGLHYGTFSETLPQKKLVTVSIPYGADIDLTDRLNKGGWTNGAHQLKFLMYSDTEEERIAAKDALIALVHGKRAQYTLTWDEEYTYTGRASVSIEHRSENVDLVTIDIDRYPWKVIEVEEKVSLVEQYGEIASTRRTVEYDFKRHTRYRDVTVTALTSVEGKWSTDTLWTTYGVGSATDEPIASDIYSGVTYEFRLGSITDWLMRVDEPTQTLIVKSTHISYSGNDATIDKTPVINESIGDIYFPDIEKQYITLKYEAWDI